MDENAEHQQDSFPQESQEHKNLKKKRTGERSVSSLVPAVVWLSTIFFVGKVVWQYMVVL